MLQVYASIGRGRLQLTHRHVLQIIVHFHSKQCQLIFPVTDVSLRLLGLALMVVAELALFQRPKKVCLIGALLMKKASS